MDKQNETVTISKAEYENMQSQIDWLTERVHLLSKKQFGVSSEKIVDDELVNQIGMIFNETEYISLTLPLRQKKPQSKNIPTAVREALMM